MISIGLIGTLALMPSASKIGMAQAKLTDKSFLFK